MSAKDEYTFNGYKDQPLSTDKKKMYALFAEEQCKLIKISHPFLTDAQIKKKVQQKWNKEMEPFRAKKGENEGDRSLGQPARTTVRRSARTVKKASFARSVKRKGTQHRQSAFVPLEVSLEDSKSKQKIAQTSYADLKNSLRVTFNSDPDVYYRTASETSAATANTPIVSPHHHAKTYDYGNRRSPRVACKNISKPYSSFQHITNPNCSWSYKSEKIRDSGAINAKVQEKTDTYKPKNMDANNNKPGGSKHASGSKFAPEVKEPDVAVKLSTARTEDEGNSSSDFDDLMSDIRVSRDKAGTKKSVAVISEKSKKSQVTKKADVLKNKKPSKRVKRKTKCPKNLKELLMSSSSDEEWGIFQTRLSAEAQLTSTDNDKEIFTCSDNTRQKIQADNTENGGSSESLIPPTNHTNDECGGKGTDKEKGIVTQKDGSNGTDKPDCYQEFQNYSITEDQEEESSEKRKTLSDDKTNIKSDGNEVVHASTSSSQSKKYPIDIAAIFDKFSQEANRFNDCTLQRNDEKDLDRSSNLHSPTGCSRDTKLFDSRRLSKRRKVDISPLHTRVLLKNAGLADSNSPRYETIKESDSDVGSSPDASIKANTVKATRSSSAKEKKPVSIGYDKISSDEENGTAGRQKISDTCSKNSDGIDKTITVVHDHPDCVSDLGSSNDQIAASSRKSAKVPHPQRSKIKGRSFDISSSNETNSVSSDIAYNLRRNAQSSSPYSRRKQTPFTDRKRKARNSNTSQKNVKTSAKKSDTSSSPSAIFQESEEPSECVNEVVPKPAITRKVPAAWFQSSRDSPSNDSNSTCSDTPYTLRNRFPSESPCIEKSSSAHCSAKFGCKNKMPAPSFGKKTGRVKKDGGIEKKLEKLGIARRKPLKISNDSDLSNASTVYDTPVNAEIFEDCKSGITMPTDERSPKEMSEISVVDISSDDVCTSSDGEPVLAFANSIISAKETLYEHHKKESSSLSCQNSSSGIYLHSCRNSSIPHSLVNGTFSARLISKGGPSAEDDIVSAATDPSSLSEKSPSPLKSKVTKKRGRKLENFVSKSSTLRSATSQQNQSHGFSVKSVKRLEPRQKKLPKPEASNVISAHSVDQDIEYLAESGPGNTVVPYSGSSSANLVSQIIEAMKECTRSIAIPAFQSKGGKLNSTEDEDSSDINNIQEGTPDICQKTFHYRKIQTPSGQAEEKMIVHVKTGKNREADRHAKEMFVQVERGTNEHPQRGSRETNGFTKISFMQVEKKGKVCDSSKSFRDEMDLSLPPSRTESIQQHHSSLTWKDTKPVDYYAHVLDSLVQPDNNHVNVENKEEIIEAKDKKCLDSKRKRSLKRKNYSSFEESYYGVPEIVKNREKHIESYTDTSENRTLRDIYPKFHANALDNSFEATPVFGNTSGMQKMPYGTSTLASGKVGSKRENSYDKESCASEGEYVPNRCRRTNKDSIELGKQKQALGLKELSFSFSEQESCNTSKENDWLTNFLESPGGSESNIVDPENDKNNIIITENAEEQTTLPFDKNKRDSASSIICNIGDSEILDPDDIDSEDSIYNERTVESYADKQIINEDISSISKDSDSNNMRNQCSVPENVELPLKSYSRKLKAHAPEKHNGMDASLAGKSGTVKGVKMKQSKHLVYDTNGEEPSLEQQVPSGKKGKQNKKQKEPKTKESTVLKSEDDLQGTSTAKLSTKKPTQRKSRAKQTASCKINSVERETKKKCSESQLAEQGVDSTPQDNSKGSKKKQPASKAKKQRNSAYVSQQDPRTGSENIMLSAEQVPLVNGSKKSTGLCTYSKQKSSSETMGKDRERSLSPFSAMRKDFEERKKKVLLAHSDDDLMSISSDSEDDKKQKEMKKGKSSDNDFLCDLLNFSD